VSCELLQSAATYFGDRTSARIFDKNGTRRLKLFYRSKLKVTSLVVKVEIFCSMTRRDFQNLDTHVTSYTLLT
jgi:hypothetical protein